MRIDYEEIPKSESKNPHYKDTEKWRNASEVIPFKTTNGGASVIDEIPKGGVKQRTAELENQIKNAKPKSSNNFTSVSSPPSSSEISISSQQSSDENLDVQRKLSKSRIPIRSNSSVSFSSNSSEVSFASSTSKIPILQSSSLFNRKRLKGNNEFFYKINKAENWILISPKLLDKVKSDEKLKIDTDSRTTNALTYREDDKVRLINLHEKEILILEANLPRLCESLKNEGVNLQNNGKINIFRS
ncbi:MAG: hypothetical protein RLY40_1174 [Pseudomonadota bacterium]|jgi:hypothetical protein